MNFTFLNKAIGTECNDNEECKIDSCECRKDSNKNEMKTCQCKKGYVHFKDECHKEGMNYIKLFYEN